MKRNPVVLSRPPEDVPSTSDPQAVEHVLVCPWPQAEWYQEGLYRQGMLLFTGAPAVRHGRYALPKVPFCMSQGGPRSSTWGFIAAYTTTLTSAAHLQSPNGTLPHFKALEVWECRSSL